MKLSTVLLSSAFVSVAGGAYAAEVTHPFYVLGQGDVMSDTTYTFDSVDIDDIGKITNNVLSKRVSVGVYKDLAVYVTGSNTWARFNPDQDSAEDEDRNLAWNVGATYNLVNTGNAFVQVDANYGQKENWASVGVALKGGYDFGWAMPYAKVTGEFPVA